MPESCDTIAEKIQAWPDSSTVLLDVGAYQGDFTAELLGTNKFTRAFLFECHPANAAILREKFAPEPRVQIVPAAVGSTIGQRTFYCNSNPATGSVLPYVPNEADATRTQDIRQWSVPQTTLDQFAAAHLTQSRVGLLKIDTQGNDLEVLQGAPNLIRTHRPWILTELIYVPLYQGQGTPPEIFTCLAAAGYGLGLQLHEHYTAEGFLAFADGLFVPHEILQNFTPHFHPRPETHALQQEVTMLRHVCDERLALIQRIHAEAADLRTKIAQLERPPS